MHDTGKLDNPVWDALNSRHRALAESFGLAARYPADVSPLAALAATTSEAFADLARLVATGEPVALFTATPPDVPPEWQQLRARPLEQMVCDHLVSSTSRPFLELGVRDVPEMLALTAATEPGPFLGGTIRMGRYRGVRTADGYRLMAMAGERLRLANHTEISAVCTDPEFRGRGHAGALVVGLVGQAFADGCTPFLHVKNENGAKHLYEALGFRVRRNIQLTVIALK